jgi:hypothetical protein
MDAAKNLFHDGVPIPATTTCGVQVCTASACCNRMAHTAARCR